MLMSLLLFLFLPSLITSMGSSLQMPMMDIAGSISKTIGTIFRVLKRDGSGDGLLVLI